MNVAKSQIKLVKYLKKLNMLLSAKKAGGSENRKKMVSEKLFCYSLSQMNS